MTDLDLAWLAGFLEGEGCFHIRSVKHRSPSINVCSTDQDVIERAAELMGTTRSRAFQRTEKNKPVYTARLGSDAAIALMQKLRPHMGLRRRERIDYVLSLALSRPGFAYGERQGVAKLSESAVAEIRQTPLKWGVQTKLAKKFGVSQACIWYVVKGKSWKRVAA